MELHESGIIFDQVINQLLRTLKRTIQYNKKSMYIATILSCKHIWLIGSLLSELLKYTIIGLSLLYYIHCLGKT